VTLGVPATAASCITSGRIDVALTAAWFAFVVAVGRVPGGGQAVSELLADRAQMGTSLGFHIVFAPRVILPLLIAAAYLASLRPSTRSPLVTSMERRVGPRVSRPKGRTFTRSHPPDDRLQRCARLYVEAAAVS